MARLLAKYRFNLQLVKVTALSERVEDTVLTGGPKLQKNLAQIYIETELLAAVNA